MPGHSNRDFCLVDSLGSSRWVLLIMDYLLYENSNENIKKYHNLNLDCTTPKNKHHG